jgi:hypothetical protein
MTRARLPVRVVASPGPSGFLAALKGDKSVPEAEKREGLAQLEAALKDAKPVQFKENIALVLKYFDQLVPFMQEQPAD